MTRKTVHIIQTLAPGGIELLVMRLAAENPEKTRVLVLDQAPDRGSEAWDVAHQYAVKPRFMGKRGGVSIRLLRDLRRALAQDKPEAVFTHHIGPLLYGGLASRLAGVPNLTQVEHDAWHLDNTRQLWLTRAAYALLRPKVAAVSKPVARDIAVRTGQSQVLVIPNGVDVSRFKPGDKAAARADFNLPTDKTIVGGVGRLEYVKGFDILLRAVSQLPEDFHLALAGSGSQKDTLQDLAASLGIADRVSFLGNVNKVHQLMPAFDVLAVSSRDEGLPLTVIEAQAANVPVVATGVGGIPDAVCPEASQIVPPNDTAALTAAILMMSQAHVADAPTKFVRRMYNWKDTIRAYETLAQGGTL